ncbi:peptidoglycan-binding protein [Ciceribacter ferrooxidans]|uniref:peptidoglycan-binding protein n=1 Tax=Ciceribacter ferrooxidans TaxID=2509717 RepID=UPI0013EC7DF0|nr:peptidoglycan-binding protein [Ciceribacter ferrooxidans]
MTGIISPAQLRAAAKSRVNEANMTSLLVALDKYGAKVGLDRPHRLAQFLAQVMHESGDFRYDREIWGPTKAQARYDTRTDIGNTPAKDGDGKKFLGRTAMQITGRGNYVAFRDWCRSIGLDPPDFEKQPELINTDPWEGLGPLWYWDKGNPTGKSLNVLADRGDVETITKRINGGKTNFADRVERLTRVSLVLLGYHASEVRTFQKAAGIEVDGDVGPETRAALQKALLALTPGEAARPEVSASPVVEEKPVLPPKVEREVKTKADRTSWLVALGGSIGTTMTGLLGAQWQTVLAIGGVSLVALALIILLRGQIMAAVREIRAGVEG